MPEVYLLLGPIVKWKRDIRKEVKKIYIGPIKKWKLDMYNVNVP